MHDEVKHSCGCNLSVHNALLQVTIMDRIKHDNCVKLTEMYETKAKLFMVMELLKGGELFSRIARQGYFSEKQAADLSKQIASSLMYVIRQSFTIPLLSMFSQLVSFFRKVLARNWHCTQGFEA